MKLRRTWAITRKELLQIRRDPLSLAMAFLMPVILLLIYGYAITFDVDRIPTAVYDQDKSSLSRELVAELRESGYFRVVRDVSRYGEIDGILDRREAKAALVIPHDFSEKVRTGRRVEVAVILDGSDSNTATIAQGYLAAITERFARRVQGLSGPPLIEARSRVWYNPELKSRFFIIPGLIAVIMSVIIALLTSLTIAREWDRGTMEQLISTPVRTPELILGKLIPYFLIGFADTILSLVMTTALFGVPLRGSLPLLLGFSSLFLFGGLSFGILISIVGRTQLVASQLAMLTSFLPSFMLSGFIYSTENMPVPLQVVSYVAVPARYFVSALKGIFLKGSPAADLALEALLLAAFAALVFLGANRKFRKRMD